MKRKCKILQALFLYAMVTMPRIAVAANPSGVILNPEQVRALDSKLQSKTIQTNGLSLSSDREAILKAVKNLNGNAIVDFSSGKSAWLLIRKRKFVSSPIPGKSQATMAGPSERFSVVISAVKFF